MVVLHVGNDLDGRSASPALAAPVPGDARDRSSAALAIDLTQGYADSSEETAAVDLLDGAGGAPGKEHGPPLQ